MEPINSTEQLLIYNLCYWDLRRQFLGAEIWSVLWTVVCVKGCAPPIPGKQGSGKVAPQGSGNWKGAQKCNPTLRQCRLWLSRVSISATEIQLRGKNVTKLEKRCSEDVCKHERCCNSCGSCAKSSQAASKTAALCQHWWWFGSAHATSKRPRESQHYLGHHVLHELLSSKARFHSHDQGHVDLVRPGCKFFYSGARFYGQADLQRHSVPKTYLNPWIHQTYLFYYSLFCYLHATLFNLLDEVSWVSGGL